VSRPTNKKEFSFAIGLKAYITSASSARRESNRETENQSRIEIKKIFDTDGSTMVMILVTPFIEWKLIVL
jgi:hypothetical protein